MPKIKILMSDNNVVEKHISSFKARKLTDSEKELLKNKLKKFADKIINENKIDVDLFIEIIDLSPNPNDSEFLNNLIKDIQVWKSYKEDFDEEISFPIQNYFNILIPE